MALLPCMEEDQATGEVAQVFADFRNTKGTTFVPNFFKVLAVSPTAAKGTWSVYRDVGHHGNVPRTIKEMIFVAISQARRCGYCEAAHLAICRVFGVDAATLKTLTEDLENLRPQRTRDIIRFALKVATDPQGLGQADYDDLRRLGVSDSDLAEIVAMAAFSVYANIVADATKVEIDEGFQELLRS